MMSAIANSLQKPDRFDLYVRKFRAICAMHGVQVGSRADLPGFMQKLLEDRALAMDFWALIGKLSNREGGELSDDQMLAVVVEGVMGGELSGYDRETKRIIDDLRAMLAGVDIQGPAQVELAPFPRNETGPPQGDGEWKTRVIELPLRSPDSRAAFTPEAVDVEAGRTGASTQLPLLNEALLRVEITRLVKEYFENVDKRACKLEPYPKGVTSMGTVASPMTRRSLESPPEKPAREEMDDLPLMSISNPRLVLEPAGSPVEKPLTVKDYALSIRVPLEGYSPSEGYGKFVLVMLLIVALLEVGFAAYRHRIPLRKEFNSLINKIEDRALEALANPNEPPARSADREVPEEQVEPSQPSAEQKEPSRPSTELPPSPRTSTPPPANAGVRDTLEQAASAGSPVAGGLSGSSSNRKGTPDHVAVQAEPAPANGISHADLAGAIRVDPAVMEADLVVSRVPAYPGLAKVDRIQGPVVMLAIISTDGLVKRVQVIRGDSRLRSAAMEAVSKRRYRPYLLNGRPVNVATTITVDFTLDR
jgi:TonB family protein